MRLSGTLVESHSAVTTTFLAEGGATVCVGIVSLINASDEGITTKAREVFLRDCPNDRYLSAAPKLPLLSRMV